MTVHELKDLAMIYNDCDDYDVKVWEPESQRSMDIYFTGSSKPDEKNPNGQINFNVSYKDNLGDNGVLDAFKEMAKAKGWADNDDELKGLVYEFLKLMLAKRNGDE